MGPEPYGSATAPRATPPPRGYGLPMAKFTIDELIARLRAVPKGGADIDFDKARAALERQTAKAPLHDGTTTTPVDAGGVPAEWVDPATPPTERAGAILYLHGGGYVMGSIGTPPGAGLAPVAAAADARVLLIDYRLAPEHPFPAGVDDAVAAWRWMVGPGGADPTRSVIAGDSAGGGLTAATILALKQAGDPAPAGVVCISPFVDMEATGETHTTKADDDPWSATDGLKAMVDRLPGAAPTPATPSPPPSTATGPAPRRCSSRSARTRCCSTTPGCLTERSPGRRRARSRSRSGTRWSTSASPSAG